MGWIERRKEIIKEIKIKIQSSPSLTDWELLEAIMQKWTCQRRTAREYLLSARSRNVNWETKTDQDRWLNLTAKDRADYEKEKHTQKLTEVEK